MSKRGLLSPDSVDSLAPAPSASRHSLLRIPFAGSQPPQVSEGGEREKCASKGSRLERFSCWCPKVMAAIGHLPETLADRCIVIRMQRKTQGQECEKLRNLDGSVLRRKCARFVMDHAKKIASAHPAMPAELNDRAADVWEPLFALAGSASDEWIEKARRASLGLTGLAEESSPLAILMSRDPELF